MVSSHPAIYRHVEPSIANCHCEMNRRTWISRLLGNLFSCPAVTFTFALAAHSPGRKYSSLLYHLAVSSWIDGWFDFEYKCNYCVLMLCMPDQARASNSNLISILIYFPFLFVFS
jgi:hypothetical protein